MTYQDFYEWDRLSARLRARIKHAMGQSELYRAVLRAISLSVDEPTYSYGVWFDAEGTYVERHVDKIGRVPINAHHVGDIRGGAFTLSKCSKD